MKAAIVGCGVIARTHASALEALANVELVAVVDRDAGAARELADRVEAAGALRPRVYTDLTTMLAQERPDGVHVLTPPTTHEPLAVEAMAAGSSVLVEKPMALSVAEADRMIAAAHEHGVTLATNHNYLFKPSVAKALDLVAAGEVGEVVDVVTYYGASGEDSTLATGAGAHWAWRLPGGVFTNHLPHVLYLHEAFTGPIERVTGVALGGGDRDTGGPEGPATEMLAVTEGAVAPGTMRLSMRAKPYMKYVEVFGTEAMIRADLVREVCTISRHRPAPGAVQKVSFNLEQVSQLTVGTAVSTVNVLSGRWKGYPGLRVLVQRFYADLAAGQPPAVSGEDGRAVVVALEQLWEAAPRLERSAAQAATEAAAAKLQAGPRTDAEGRLGRYVEAFRRDRGYAPRAVVTGATGFLGRRISTALARCGVDVTALTRDHARVPFDVETCARVVEGGLDEEALTGAIRDADLVFHCAAVTTNSASWDTHRDVNIEGTNRVLAVSAAAGVERVIHVSSVIVYGLESPPRPGPVSEDTPLSAAQDHWAYYERSKVGAEDAAGRWIDKGLPVTVIRPGVLYGPGRAPKGGLVQVGSTRVTVGAARNHLPLTYVDNAVDAVLIAAIEHEAVGEAFNVVDDPQVTVRQAMAIADAGRSGPARPRVIPLPPALLAGAAKLLERRAEQAGKQTPPKLSQFVIGTASRDIVYDTAKAREVLGWQQEVGLREGLRRATSS